MVCVVTGGAGDNAGTKAATGLSIPCDVWAVSGCGLNPIRSRLFLGGETPRSKEDSPGGEPSFDGGMMANTWALLSDSSSGFRATPMNWCGGYALGMLGGPAPMRSKTQRFALRGWIFCEVRAKGRAESKITSKRATSHQGFRAF
jgi:hypothetical protein